MLGKARQLVGLSAVDKFVPSAGSCAPALQSGLQVLDGRALLAFLAGHFLAASQQQGLLMHLADGR